MCPRGRGRPRGLHLWCIRPGSLIAYSICFALVKHDISKQTTIALKFKFIKKYVGVFARRLMSLHRLRNFASQWLM